MPELPDLTVFAENLAKAVVGRTVAEVRFHGRGRLNVPAEELPRALVKARVTAVERTGKQISFRTGNGSELRVHLMLTGGFVLLPSSELDSLGAVVISITFTDGTALAVTDQKGWASVSLNPAEAEAPDALQIDVGYLQRLCDKKPKTLIKPLLIDQALLGGIGNAYVDEILWEARISPKSVAGKLPPEAVAALARAIPAVLNDAIGELRTRHPEMISGEYREFLKVHRPDLKSSPTGARIIKENVQSKPTYYTEEQRLYR